MFEFKPEHKFTVLKLLYLPLRARAEALRMLLRHTGPILKRGSPMPGGVART